MEEQVIKEELSKELLSFHERNLFHYPIGVSRHLRGKQMVYRFTVRDKTTGRELTWTISPSSEYGLPGPQEEKVFRTLEFILSRMRKGTEQTLKNPIYIPVERVCKEMGRKPNPIERKRVRNAIRRIVYTTYAAENSLYSRAKRKWVSKVDFHPIYKVVFKGEEIGEDENGKKEYAPRTEVWFDDFLLDNINSGYIQPFDFEMYRSFKTDIAPGLFLMIYPKLFGMRNAEYLRMSYKEICDRLGLKKESYLADIKHAFKKPLNELIEKKIITKYAWMKQEQEKDFILYLYPGKYIHKLNRRWWRDARSDDTFKVISIDSPKDAHKLLCVLFGIPTSPDFLEHLPQERRTKALSDASFWRYVVEKVPRRVLMYAINSARHYIVKGKGIKRFLFCGIRLIQKRHSIHFIKHIHLALKMFLKLVLSTTLGLRT